MATLVTVKDIQKQCERLSDKQVRGFLRKAGLKAPPTGLAGMNPKAKYEFDLDDPAFQKTYRELIELDRNPKQPDKVRRVVIDDSEEL